jgi:hypothetical protein
VRQYVALNAQDRFDRIPHGRYINFVADYLAAEPNADRAAAIRAWHTLKTMDVPKDYAAARRSRNRANGLASRTAPLGRARTDRRAEARPGRPDAPARRLPRPA